MITEQLYYTDSHIFEFSAVVKLCEKSDSGYCVLLDKTAFFPEGGGQKCDTGTIGGVRVTAVEIRDGEIYHTVDSELKAGDSCECKIDRDKRFARMQNHSGEHIVSGIVHRRFGYDNVGFHMDDESVTVDFNGELSREELDSVEYEANKAVFENRRIKTYFPEPDTLSSLNYRSKLDLTEDVRLVEIDGIDLCACCAPHVSLTGEIGIIKILDFSRHRGGVRIVMKCGEYALFDYRNKYSNILAISNELSVKQELTADGVCRLKEELVAQKLEFYDYKAAIVKAESQKLAVKNNCVVWFGENFDSDMLRMLVNNGKELCTGVVAAFCGSDENGYSYVASSEHTDMNIFAKNMNSTLNGRGGGRDGMIQGKLMSAQSEITDFFNKII